MSRGDKRERDREKNQRKLQDKARQEARVSWHPLSIELRECL